MNDECQTLGSVWEVLHHRCIIYPPASTPSYRMVKNLFWWHSGFKRDSICSWVQRSCLNHLSLFYFKNPHHCMFIACRRSWKCSRAFRSPAAAFRMHMFVLRKTQAGHPQGEGGERLWNSSAIEIATNPLRDHTSNKGGEFNRIHVPRGNVQPKRHGEMLDPFGRHLVSMTSGKTDHLTCQDAHLQCMEAQWQRAKWEVIYRSQNHRNQIGRKQGGLCQ